jgi:hypothetical protein
MLKKISTATVLGTGLVMAAAILSPAQAKWVEGSCSVFDATATTAGEDFAASECGNFTGNDSQVGFIDYLNRQSSGNGKAWTDLSGYDANDAEDAAFASAVDALNGEWSLFGKSDSGGDKVADIGGELQRGNFNFTEGLDGPFVVVQKASTFYSAYLFKDLEEATSSGTFDVAGITQKSNGRSGAAGLSHISVYSMKRLPVTSTPETSKIPEPAAGVGLVVFGVVAARLKRHKLA